MFGFFNRVEKVLFGHHNEIRVLTFRALALRRSDEEPANAYI